MTVAHQMPELDQGEGGGGGVEALHTLLKIINPYVPQPLAIIFNGSINLVIFPDKLKFAKVISCSQERIPH